MTKYILVLVMETWFTSCVAVFWEFLLALCLDSSAKIAGGGRDH